MEHQIGLKVSSDKRIYNDVDCFTASILHQHEWVNRMPPLENDLLIRVEPIAQQHRTIDIRVVDASSYFCLIRLDLLLELFASPDFYESAVHYNSIGVPTMWNGMLMPDHKSRHPLQLTMSVKWHVWWATEQVIHRHHQSKQRFSTVVCLCFAHLAYVTLKRQTTINPILRIQFAHGNCLRVCCLLYVSGRSIEESEKNKKKVVVLWLSCSWEMAFEFVCIAYSNLRV